MAIKKIISSGTTGAESAALDVAIRLKIPYGGYAIANPIFGIEQRRHRYRLTRKAFQHPSEKDKANLRMAGSVLIFTHGHLTEGLDSIQTEAMTHEYPCLHIDLGWSSPLHAAFQIERWAHRQVVEMLFVAGTGTHEDDRIYTAAYDALYRFLTIGKASYSGSTDGNETEQRVWPRTIKEAVQRLIEDLSLKDKTTIANMSASELSPLNHRIGRYIQTAFGLDATNHALLWSCAGEAGKPSLTPKEASAIIISCLALELEKTHKLRLL